MKAPKPATVNDLIAVIAESNKAHDFAFKIGAIKPGIANPLLDNLYIAATHAAKALQPLMQVEVKTSLPQAAEPKAT